MSQTPRRRAWGKPKERENILIVDQMEIDALPTQPISSATTSTATQQSGPTLNLQDLQQNLHHPEMMLDQQLVSILREMRVPVGADTERSREQLLLLFKKHVLPKPQRTRSAHRRKRKSAAQIETTNEAGDTSWSGTDEGGFDSDWSVRKRSSSGDDELPPSKKPATPISSACSKKLNSCHSPTAHDTKRMKLDKSEGVDSTPSHSKTSAAQSRTTPIRPQVTWP